jgi:hypothetical protein
MAKSRTGLIHRFAPLLNFHYRRQPYADQTCFVWIVNKNQRDTIIGQEISRADVLLVAPIIRECDCLVI